MAKLYRSSTNKKLAGVCGGMAEHFDIDATIVRLIWAFLTFLSWGTGLILYVIAAFIIPEEETVKLENMKEDADVNASDVDDNDIHNNEKTDLEDK